jgi:hypothetical protein
MKGKVIGGVCLPLEKSLTKKTKNIDTALGLIDKKNFSEDVLFKDSSSWSRAMGLGYTKV